VLIFACKGDRTPTTLLGCLAEACKLQGLIFTTIICVQLYPERSFHSAEELMKAANICFPYCKDCRIAKDTEIALKLCDEITTSNFLVTGSLYLVSEVLRVTTH